jgi:hypothetical protein
MLQEFSFWVDPLEGVVDGIGEGGDKLGEEGVDTLGY